MVLDLLHYKGFSDKWINWIKSILDSPTSSILLNGVSGKKFACKKGVRQCDPLSPLLFVLAADFLQTIINEACRREAIGYPLGPDFGGDYPMFNMQMTQC